MVEGLLIDLNDEVVRLVLGGKEVPEKLIKTADDRYLLNKKISFFKNYPNARKLGLALLEHFKPEEAQGLYGIYLRDHDEKSRGKILRGMNERAKAKPTTGRAEELALA